MGGNARGTRRMRVVSKVGDERWCALDTGIPENALTRICHAYFNASWTLTNTTRDTQSTTTSTRTTAKLQSCSCNNPGSLFSKN